MSTQELYVAAWKQSGDAVIALAGELTAEQLATETDCPGWSVQDVIAHLAHLEHVLLGPPEPTSGDAKLSSTYTEAGVEQRREVPIERIIDELRDAVTRRHGDLSTRTVDLAAPADVTPAGAPWTWETQLRNRVVDMWSHEQDIRRAVELPGNLDSPAAQVTVTTFASNMGYVLGKRVGATPGTRATWNLTGGVPLTVSFEIDPTGRAQGVDPDSADPTVKLTMTSETFAILAAGRRPADATDVEVTGDADLAQAILNAMTLTF